MASSLSQHLSRPAPDLCRVHPLSLCPLQGSKHRLPPQDTLMTSTPLVKHKTKSQPTGFQLRTQTPPLVSTCCKNPTSNLLAPTQPSGYLPGSAVFSLAAFTGRSSFYSTGQGHSLCSGSEAELVSLRAQLFLPLRFSTIHKWFLAQ